MHVSYGIFTCTCHFEMKFLNSPRTIENQKLFVFDMLSGPVLVQTLNQIRPLSQRMSRTLIKELVFIQDSLLRLPPI